MQFQYDFLGGSVPQNLGLLVCPRCVDPLTWQQKLLILPPDPAPIFNTRPEPYTVDETNWLTTEDGDILTTESGSEFITQIPNPATAADTSYLVCEILSPGGSVAVCYLDLFDGDPASGGGSVLSAITGSATRTNVAADLTTTLGIAQNLATLVIAAASAGVASVTHVGIYDAATAGTLLMSGALSASPTIAEGNPVEFAALALSINLN